MKITEQQLCSMFDHTFLKPFGTTADFDRICEEAILIKPACVSTNPVPMIYVKKKLLPYGIKVDTGIGFPLGGETIETKEFEVKDAIANGADEVDYLINISKAKDHDWDYLDEEMQRLIAAAHGSGRLIKVILETCYLDDAEKIKICQLGVKNKIDFVKTSTGFGTGGATVADIRLMKDIVGNAVKVKASGGIRDWASCKAMIEAGAERIGCSASLRILEEFRKENQ